MSLAALSAVFVLDRFLKIWVVRSFPEGGGFPIIDPWVRLTRVSNTGAAFGLWKGSGIFLAIFAAASFLFILFYIFKKPDRSNIVAWALVAGGALGNLVDRFLHGYVIDYLDFRVWPVFNLADASICVGVFWIVLCFTLFHPKETDASHSR